MLPILLHPVGLTSGLCALLGYVVLFLIADALSYQFEILQSDQG
jgi:hypothetical protein